MVTKVSDSTVPQEPLNFPSRKALASCLIKHPLIRENELLSGKPQVEKKVIDYVTELFANTKYQEPMEVDFWCWYITREIKDRYGQPLSFMELRHDIAHALEDCSSSKKFNVKKTNS